MQSFVEDGEQIPSVFHFQPPTSDAAEGKTDIPSKNTWHKFYRYIRIRIRGLLWLVIWQQ